MKFRIELKTDDGRTIVEEHIVQKSNGSVHLEDVLAKHLIGYALEIPEKCDYVTQVTFIRDFENPKQGNLHSTLFKRK